MSDLFKAPRFETSELAREWLENVRWREGPVCSHCGAINHAYQIKKPGWYRCAKKECRKDFTVTTGTVMERSHIPLNKWLIGFHMMASNRVTAHQLHLTLDLSYKSAWFMSHRIREAMRSDGPARSSLLGVSAYCKPTDRYNQLKKYRVILYSKSGNSSLAYKRVFKCGMRGVYRYYNKKHLHRYLAELDFRRSHRTSFGYSKIDRTVAAIKGAEGKRLIYR